MFKMRNILWLMVVFVLTWQGFGEVVSNVQNVKSVLPPANAKPNQYVRDSADVPKIERQYSHGQGSQQVAGSGGAHIDHKNSYNLLSEAMTQAVSNEFSELL